MSASNIKVGVEIECIYNKDKMPILTIGNYGDPKPTKGLAGWKLSHDGSVHTNWLKAEYARSGEVEFISSVAMGKKMFMNYLKDFKKFVSKNGEQELKDVIVFNSSCGCHVHFSIKNFTFQHKVWYMQFPKVRKFFFDKVKESNIKDRAAIIAHYQRNFAKKFQRCHMDTRKERRVEFNFLSEDEGTGFELRGINLLGVSTWKEFDEMFEIIWDTLEYLYEQATCWSCNQFYMKTGKQILTSVPSLVTKGKIEKVIDIKQKLNEYDAEEVFQNTRFVLTNPYGIQ
jgi:hypothetical protein